MSINIDRARCLYHEDPTFRQAVDMNRSLIQQLHLAPAELRAAAMFACIMEAERAMPSLIFHSDDTLESFIKRNR